MPKRQKHMRRAITPSCGLRSPRHWPKPQRQLLNQGYFTDKKPIQEISECAKKMAQSVKCLPCNHEDLSSNPSTHVKSRAWQCVLILLGVWGREGTRGFSQLAGQPSLLGKSNEGLFPKQTNKNKRKNPVDNTPHICAHSLT